MNGHPGHTANGVDTDNVGGSRHDYDRGRQGTARRSSATTRPAGGGAAAGNDAPSISIDALSLLRPASRRWYWVVLGGMLGACAGAALGTFLWQPYYTAKGQILAFVPQVSSDHYQPQRLQGPTLVGMIQSPEVFKQMGEKMDPPVPGPLLASLITVQPERQSDIVGVSASAGDPAQAVELVNKFSAEVIAFTQEHQRREAIQAELYTDEYLKEVERDVAEARKAMPAHLATNTLGGEMTPMATARVAERIQAAREELAKELLTYTDIHPRVKQKRAALAALEAQVPAHLLDNRAFTPGASVVAPTSSDGMGISREEFELAIFQLKQREQMLSGAQQRKRAIQVYKTEPPGHFRVMQAATVDNIEVHSPNLKIILVAGFFATLGMVAAGAELLRREFFDNRLKTEADVKRVTGLPVLGTVGDLRSMSLAGREDWAFRTWIALQDRLAYSPNHGLICGITSSNSGDGRSTWINLLAGAARKCGFRVLTIATRSTADTVLNDDVTEPVVEGPAPEAVPVGAGAEAEEINGRHARPAAAGTIARAAPNGGSASRMFAGDSEFTALTASALFTPAMVTEKLTGPETDPLVHIPLPGWTWNLERRKQWQGALNVWRKIDNVVILVELPPASMPESVLLASNLPNLVWLVESGKSEATSTRVQLETLRHARCNLVGAVINRALSRMTEGRFSRWVGCLALFSLLSLFAPALQAGDAAPTGDPMDVLAQFSVVSPAQRAAWQQRLTLGPGDIVNISLYGEPLLAAEEVPIGPDGRISYLEAQNVMAAGLTVDEFRERLNEELGRFRREPLAYVVPVAYNSKKYFVLGKVTQGGVFTLDRPLTLIEAVARARGMETGIGPDSSLVELADLSRSFIARGGRRLAVDFEKLFQEGDLSQNVALEPNDYIYFPAAAQREVYVLGAVLNPGTYIYTSSTGALGAIAARGGFSERAWKSRLLVIRGSLNRPQTFVIDGMDILTGQKADLKLQPKDIVFVSDRPWIRAEEILNLAAEAFVTAAVVVWTGQNVNPAPVITSP